LCEGQEQYRTLRSELEKAIDGKFIKTLPGDAAISHSDAISDVGAYLRHCLAIKLVLQRIAPERAATDKSQLRRSAFHIWCEFLQTFVDSESENDKNQSATAKTEWKRPDYLADTDDTDDTDYEQLDRLADHFDPADIGSRVQEELKAHSGALPAFARMLHGGTPMHTRHALQAQFNTQDSFPLVLLAQSQVGREGLNLHKACRTVILLHSEWNPGVLEQQIGRVDRIESLWHSKTREWKGLCEEGRNGHPMPTINIRPIVFEGTYDEFQFEVAKKRRETLRAHLFGELLSEEALEQLQQDKELLEQLRAAAPRFSPPRDHNDDNTGSPATSDRL
jgi:hypothetical protein